LIYFLQVIGNIALLYNKTLGLVPPGGYRPPFPSDWSYSYALDAHNICHAFQFAAILRDWFEQGVTLELPHEGVQDARLQVAIWQRNRRMREEGDKESKDHICDVICIEVKGEDGEECTYYLNLPYSIA
jgi:hypothetical protein